jgi:hypothetical protein
VAQQVDDAGLHRRLRENPVICRSSPRSTTAFSASRKASAAFRISSIAVSACLRGDGGAFACRDFSFGVSAGCSALMPPMYAERAAASTASLDLPPRCYSAGSPNSGSSAHQRPGSVAAV